MNRVSIRHAAGIVAALMAITAIGALAPTNANVKSEKNIKACVTWGGARSAINAAEFLRITDAQAWRETWTRHVGDRTEGVAYAEILPPEIDFDRFMLVAVFEGMTNQTANVSVESIEEIDDHVLIRFVPWTYAVAWGLNEEPTREDLERLKTTPYGFFVLPRIDKAIVLERQRGGKSSPITWEHAARIDAM